ncbi:hypothetical protein C5167_002473 [Papaver somniferum]|uniref:SKP1-like protein n=1 Tax=Papaver somniferum TaxID=3469 RepID=A0A4Y7L226_PAPSO|nr:SKP1-like protein 1A [Papaver somniferum]XP_026414205.1 SKP1-like protein 1A [Papaver somniferum]RZC78255.1 hypothetical protein C5167_002473 [Papaver somniferum]
MSTPSKMISLKSSEGEIFEVEEIIAHHSLTIKHMIEEDCADNPIPLANVNSKILKMVIEYGKKHRESGGEITEVDEETQKWDKELVNVDQETLFRLLMAANYLNIKNLLDLTCETVASMIRGKTIQEIRDTFGIKNDFTPEEEEEVRNENEWAFN